MTFMFGTFMFAKHPANHSNPYSNDQNRCPQNVSLWENLVKCISGPEHLAKIISID